MTAIRSLVQVSLLAACAATSFVSAQVYVVAKDEVQQEPQVSTKSDPAVKLLDNGDETKALSPIFPTTKYANSAPAPVATAKRPAKQIVAARHVKAPVKIAARPASNRPLQLAAYSSAQPVAYGYAPEPPQPRAASIFGQLR